MTWGAYGAQNPSEGGIWRHEVSEVVNRPISETAGQGQERPAHDKRPQQDSNLRSRLRRPLLSPLSYGGCATPKATSRQPRADTSRRGVSAGVFDQGPHGRPLRASVTNVLSVRRTPGRASLVPLNHSRPSVRIIRRRPGSIRACGRVQGFIVHNPLPEAHILPANPGLGAPRCALAPRRALPHNNTGHGTP